MPEDLLKFGLIPELIGRLPVVTTLRELSVADLTRILTEPRNALVKQYQKLFDLDGVELEFTEDAITSIADKAMERGTGARGLRAIIEEVLLHVMFDVPSRGDIAKVYNAYKARLPEGLSAGSGVRPLLPKNKDADAVYKDFTTLFARIAKGKLWAWSIQG